MLKRKVADHMSKERLISPYDEFWGRFGDDMVPYTYNTYTDTMTELLLVKLQEYIEKNTGLELTPTYSFARVYTRGNILKPHKDRIQCEISGTLALGGDMWPIQVGGKSINLNEGDLLIYRGCDVEHGRKKFEGELCAQTFLHYTTIETAKKHNTWFDGRKFIGIPKL